MLGSPCQGPRTRTSTSDLNVMPGIPLRPAGPVHDISDIDHHPNVTATPDNPATPHTTSTTGSTRPQIANVNKHLARGRRRARDLRHGGEKGSAGT